MAFDCLIRRAVENEKVIFPKKFCKTDLEADKHNKNKSPKDHVKSLEGERRAMRSVYRFMCQYFNDPIDEETVEFKRNYIQHLPLTGDVVKKLEAVSAIISIDPAIRLKETNDRTGIVVTKTLPEEKQIVIMEAIGKRLSVDKLVDEIFRLTQIYKTERVLIETFGAQLWLVKILKDEMIKKGHFFNITEVKGSTRESKVARIRGLLPYYANHRILHRHGLEELEAELLQFPRSKHDDIIDALAYQILFWKDILLSQKPITFEKNRPFSVDWFKSKIPRFSNEQEKIFKGVIRRRSRF